MILYTTVKLLQNEFGPTSSRKEVRVELDETVNTRDLLIAAIVSQAKISQHSYAEQDISINGVIFEEESIDISTIQTLEYRMFLTKRPARTTNTASPEKLARIQQKASPSKLASMNNTTQLRSFKSPK